jgi:hypothetical protein
MTETLNQPEIELLKHEISGEAPDSAAPPASANGHFTETATKELSLLLLQPHQTADQ